MATKRKKKPIIFTIDDEITVLNAVERDLRKKYGKEYRIMKSSQSTEALKALQNLKKRGDVVALFIADQRMPGMEGTEFLSKALDLYPDSKRVLLTAYADTKAAITGINEIGLDHYISKPWDPPEERLFPIIDDLLYDWDASYRPPYDGIRVVGTLWNPNTHHIKDFFARNRIPYKFEDIEKDESHLKLLEQMKLGMQDIPVVLFPDGSHFVNPNPPDLAEKVGMKTEAETDFYDLVIIGGGPAGLAAGVYAASEGLRSIIIEKEATGGQAGTSSRIENYLGFPKGIGGGDLARRATVQAERLGCEILVPREVVGIDLEDNYKVITLDDGTKIRCHALIISTGVEVRRFNVPGEEKLTGAGVYYGAAMTEAASYRDQEVYILGGGNSAGQGAMFFSRYAKKVNIVIRRPDLTATMSQYLIDQINATDNIELIANTTIEEVKGDKHLDKLILKDKNSGEEREVDAAALFIFIGAAPRTDMIAHLVERDEKGYILTGTDLNRVKKSIHNWKLDRDPFLFETNVPGIFAAGDVRHDSSKRVAAAVGEGAVTVRLIHQYLKEV